MPWRDGLYARLSEPVARGLAALTGDEAGRLEEIRVRVGQPVELVIAGESRLIGGAAVSAAGIKELVAALSGYALYAVERQMAQGYIPLPGGHRAGVCGQLTQEEGGRVRLCAVTSVCIRIARQIDGASEPVRHHLLDAAGRPARVLLIGPPGCGKTTVLRDAALFLSQACRLHVAVADERSELFGAGRPAGGRMDVLSGGGKAQAMLMLLRSMAPQVIVTDELGGEEDAQAVLEIARCGVGLLATAHAGSIEEARRRPTLGQLLSGGAMDKVILLGVRGACLRVWDAAKRGGELIELGSGGDGDDQRERSRFFAG